MTAAVDPEVLEENGRPLDQQLRSLRLLAPGGAATGLGVLLGGFDPTQLLPGAYVQFVRFAGTDTAAAVADDQEIRDNLINVTAKVESLLQVNNRRQLLEEEPWVERPRPQYPMAALREAVLNALVHRVYEGSNAPVRILWFDDRVEITNPGGPFGIVSSTNFDQENDYRNPALAAALKTLGLVNRFGRGISRMRTLMQRNGNPDPCCRSWPTSGVCAAWGHWERLSGGGRSPSTARTGQRVLTICCRPDRAPLRPGGG